MMEDWRTDKVHEILKVEDIDEPLDNGVIKKLSYSQRPARNRGGETGQQLVDYNAINR